MWIHREQLQNLVFGASGGNRYTQDSPVMPDVWFHFGKEPREPLDLLMAPHRRATPAKLAKALDTLGKAREKDRWPELVTSARIAYDESYVAAKFDFATMVRVALPLSGWWKSYPGSIWKLSSSDIRDVLAGSPVADITDSGRWLLRVLGTLVWAHESPDPDTRAKELPKPDAYADALAKLLRGTAPKKSDDTMLWSINRNRKASIAVWASTKTIKADAATMLFSLKCDNLAWAVLDTGIDAKHPAFRKRRSSNGALLAQRGKEARNSRVVKTYDFTRVRDLLNSGGEELPEELAETGTAELRRRLRRGQSIDWELLEPLIEIPHDKHYRVPGHPHGTHVAGILAADWRRGDKDYDEDEDLRGVCPDMRLYDLRVLDDKGRGDEFSILAALQFIRHLNSRSRRPVIQGVNLSLAIPHDVSNFACGRTPVCDEAERVHGSGVVVVAAAGNEGYVHYLTTSGETEAYQNISITDPGNAEAVLTVGATHRRRPHTYGVSYFSSRGPTGDGRVKPDLVAPGEKIKGPVPDLGIEAKDGTSMAAPHVSGAAALIMSRHPEFIGDPDRIKQVLCDTATDLGRERYFQGAGLVDVCRALQSL